MHNSIIGDSNSGGVGLAPTSDKEGRRIARAVPVLLPEEVELVGVPCVEIRVLWGEDVIGVKHLTPPRDFYVGEPGHGLTVDFLLPREKLRGSRVPLVLVEGSSVSVVLPAEALGHIEFADAPPMSLSEARSRSMPCSQLTGAHTLPLAMDAKARIHLADFVFEVHMVAAGKAPPHKLANNLRRHATYFALSVASVASLMLTAAFLVPPMGTTRSESIDHERLILIQQYLASAAEREQELFASLHPNALQKEKAATSARAKEAEGMMGKVSSPKRDRRSAVQGPKTNPDPHLSRHQVLSDAAEFGMLALLNADVVGDPNAPTAAWGRKTSLGVADSSAVGLLFDGDIGDAFGAGGLGVSGVARGGGFRGDMTGVGSVGTLGHGLGRGPDKGFGAAHGRLPGSHIARAPKVRMGVTEVSGRLPKEVIQRIVRQNFGRFRLCYENGLSANPHLAGRVSVRFAINRNGTVSNASHGDSSLPDAKVAECVVRAFYALTFPKPAGGIVTVVYPISFAPE